jgi:TolB-like protein/DNA-binding winged helix-turn-helix (wHTH) protein
MTDGSGRRVASFDEWVLFRAPLELRRNGETVPLQDQPLQILEALVRRAGELVTREELSSLLWPKGVVDFDAGLNTAVRKLRVALGDDADAPRYLETVPRQGYRFVGKLTPALIDPAERAAPPRPTPSKVHRAWFAIIGSLVVGAVLAIWRLATPAGPPVPVVAHYRLAVLPFESLSPDAANAFFADGMHEEILSALANRAPSLEIISRTTMRLYRLSSKPIPAIADELGATHVLEGSVRREADTVRVTLQLIDGATDKHLWSHSYDRKLVNVMTLQAEMAREVAAQLAVELPQSQFAGSPPPRTAEAYDLWLKGVLAWQEVGGGGATLQQIERVEDMYTQAIALDRTYGAAYADRARVRTARFVSRADGSRENLDGARSDIALAQKYAGATPHVLVRAAGVAFLVDRDLPRALALIEDAERAGPLNADLMLTKANFLMFAGRIDESLAEHERAARLDPGNPALFRYWTMNLFAARRPAEALRVVEDLDRRFPGRLSRGEQLFAFTGQPAQWQDEITRQKRAGETNGTLSAEFDLLRFERRLSELRVLLQAASGEFPQHTAVGSRVGASLKPVAELRAWERLLAGDTKAAARDGRELADFIASMPQEKWNEWWRRLLTAEAALFSGDRGLAITEARATLDLTNDTSTFAQLIHARALAARVLAWAHAHDEAISLLERLSVEYPCLGPALIVRDPLFAGPLAGNARWKALAQRLEAQIAANQSLARR